MVVRSQRTSEHRCNWRTTTCLSIYYLSSFDVSVQDRHGMRSFSRGAANIHVPMKACHLPRVSTLSCQLGSTPSTVLEHTNELQMC